MKDFFVSYNKADKTWAEWIAFVLEANGYTTLIQAWDFRPGGNFIQEMQKAATETEKTLVVLSENYLKAEYTQPEWAAAFARDPRGQNRTLVPFRVQECKPVGLMGQVIYVDLVGLVEEEARAAVLGAFAPRAKPAQAPAFPGRETQPTYERVAPHPVEFPGSLSTGATGRSTSIAQSAESVLSTPALRDKKISASERLVLSQNLNSVTPQQFNMLLFALSPPAGLVPPMPAAQADRTFALLGWAEGLGGCGLAAVQQLLKDILNPQ